MLLNNLTTYNLRENYVLKINILPRQQETVSGKLYPNLDLNA